MILAELSNEYYWWAFKQLAMLVVLSSLWFYFNWLLFKEISEREILKLKALKEREDENIRST